jgi:GH35 family endo-1,4-beta-xylanase
LKTKVIFYKAFYLNTILWGCESIIISAEIKYKLETFQHKAIHFILNINMHQVKDERIKNKTVRAMFGNIDKVCDFAKRKRLDFMGHMLCQEDKKLTKKLLTCWI